ncbi:restriction endonuclease subunit S [Klebsiella michiganensis]|uniref:restriction endonuclease subunit S n=1 Tax=Klebsiella michiganensis TaxID=1134687 RepID=UPI00292ECBF0|nr:restriction endonuclease subunit S [Klebsiella michiganensis]
MVPKLRFEGFNKNWAVKKLENVFSFKNGLNASKEMYGKGIKFINVLDIINNEKITFDVIQESVEATNEQISAYQVRQGDIVFQRSSETRDEVGQANVYADSETVLFGGFVIRARPLININSTFFNFQLKTDALRKDITQRSGGSTRYNIGQDSLGKVTAFFPEIREQEKIANFLSSVDEKMALLNKQYDLLCQYKKGMMQEIFSQKMRFKDDSGRAFPEWKSTILDEVVDLITNGLALNQNDSKNGYPVSRIETISECCINMKKVGFVDTDNDISNYKLNYGDMLFSNINSISHIGKIAYFDIDDTLYHGMNLLRIVIKNSHCKLFFYYQLTTDTNKKYFESRANQAVSQASINQTELRKTPVQVPCKEEQTKIANFLSALDDKIVVKKAELDKLKAWKQGLLQQMFV